MKNIKVIDLDLELFAKIDNNLHQIYLNDAIKIGIKNLICEYIETVKMSEKCFCELKDKEAAK